MNHTVDAAPTNSLDVIRFLQGSTPYQGTEPEWLLYWPPDLFAFTSYVNSLTGAYHNVVSPPSGKVWPPGAEEMTKWLTAIGNTWSEYEARLTKFADEADIHFDVRRRRSVWGVAVRYEALQWRSALGHAAKTKDDITAMLDRAATDPTSHVLRNRLVGTLPPLLKGCWSTFRLRMSEDKGSSLEELLCTPGPDGKVNASDWSMFGALMAMHAMADEASLGWGVRTLSLSGNQARDRQTMPTDVAQISSSDEMGCDKKGVVDPRGARRFAEDRLFEMGTMSTVDPTRCRVLPKRHTARIGVTMRSLSANLSFHRSSIHVRWNPSNNSPLENRMGRELHTGPSIRSDDAQHQISNSLSVLLLPWPSRINARAFRQEPIDSLEMDDAKFGFFSYDPDVPPSDGEAANDFETQLRAVLKAAKKEVRAIDIVVLPEQALTQVEHGRLEAVLGENGVSCYIAGVRRPPEKLGELGVNAVRFKTSQLCREENKSSFDTGVNIPSPETGGRWEQFKHHRWKLTDAQIRQYGLGHSLSVTNEYWEAIQVRRRKVTFFNLGEYLTVCPLICEDLARQDPIADLIRSVGPSLVVTILLDGPQRADRWPGRYASVLADDPGSSVLTLTSFGMVDRWTSPLREKNRSIALWADGQSPPQEIHLEPDAKGVLLSVSVRLDVETTADSRRETLDTARLILSGVHQVRT